MYHYLNHKKMMFLLLDLEMGGERCGIVQLSVEIVRVKKKREAKGVEKDMIANIEREDDAYNEESVRPWRICCAFILSYERHKQLS